MIDKINILLQTIATIRKEGEVRFKESTTRNDIWRKYPLIGMNYSFSGIEDLIYIFSNAMACGVVGFKKEGDEYVVFL